jgi:hypothetical protein
MLITSNALYTGIRAEIHIINRCITPVAISFVVEKSQQDFNFSTIPYVLRTINKSTNQQINKSTNQQIT